MDIFYNYLIYFLNKQLFSLSWRAPQMNWRFSIQLLLALFVSSTYNIQPNYQRNDIVNCISLNYKFPQLEFGWRSYIRFKYRARVSMATVTNSVMMDREVVTLGRSRPAPRSKRTYNRLRSTKYRQLRFARTESLSEIFVRQEKFSDYS